MPVKRPIVATLAGLLLIGCQSRAPSSSPPASVDCPAPSDWLSALLRDPEGPDRLNNVSEGWLKLYRRDYRAAIRAFEGASTADDEATDGASVGLYDAIGRRRSHGALALVDRRLARLHASTMLAYLEARHRAQAAPLASEADLATVSALVMSVEPPPWLIAPGGAKLSASLRGPPVVCGSPGKTPREVVWQQLKCPEPPACPARLSPTKGAGPWGPRLDAYAGALCDFDRVELEVLERLAADPAIVETISVPGEVVDSVKVSLFDPLATWTLAEVHRRRALAVAATSTSTPDVSAWMAHVFSDAPHAGAPPAAPDVESALAQAAEARRAAAEAKACAASDEAARLVEELGLTTSLSDGILRRTAEPWIEDAQRCGDALALLRQSADPAVTDRVTYRNEPAFLVQLASAAVCMRRLPEAIGALRAVRRSYPEAQGALTAVEQLAVARLMGGVGGLQKRQ